MPECPDTPWAHEPDRRAGREFTEPPSPASVFFLEFLRSKGVLSGTVADLGCGSGRNAVYFAKNGFEVHAIDSCSGPLGDLDLYGVVPHCGSVAECWLFEDSFFDIAMDVLCYSELKDARERTAYRGELMRTLKPGGHFLVSVPADAFTPDALAREFPSFAVAASAKTREPPEHGGVRTLSLALLRP